MRRSKRALQMPSLISAVLLLGIPLLISADDSVDPCKRQPFRGRCPPTGSSTAQTRSQFVLRYYLRNGECVSYPYGHCANDDNEPKLFRYKEECEDACLGTSDTRNEVGELGSGRAAGVPIHEQTYATAAPLPDESTQYEVLKTECQRQRDRASGLIKGGFVPRCDSRGDFEPLQCEPDGQACFCVDREGIEIKNSRSLPGEPKPDCAKINAAPPMRSNECTGPSDSGPCRAAISRWFYDESDQTCKDFKYGGCGGNGNNYATETSCKLRCVPATDPNQQCGANQMPLKNSDGSFVNCAKTNCPAGYKCNVQQQSSVCCPDVEKVPTGAGKLNIDENPTTQNVVTTIEDRSTTIEEQRSTTDFQSSTTPGNVCALPKERGPCDNYQLRFHFNTELNECKYFFYGGCEGNGNNFERVEDCEKACGGIGVQSKTSQRITSSTGAATIPEAPTTQQQQTEEEKATTTASWSTPQENETGSTTIEQGSSTWDQGSSTWQQPADVLVISDTSSTDRFSEAPTTETEQQTSQSTQQPTSQEPSSAPTTEEVGQRIFPQPTLPPVDPPRTSPPLTTTTTFPLPSNRCQHPRDEGSCGGQFVRWFWNQDAKNCETFTYNGCSGNGNNFGSREECLSFCHIQDNVCEVDIDVGDCTGSFMRYAFDRNSGECRQFQYGGCGGNGNNFASLSECKRKCGKQVQLSQNFCEHELDGGECTGAFVRFGYEAITNDCQQFTYGGCGGNGNNFATVAECRTACVKPKCPPAPECDTSRCQLVNDGHGCPFCSCPPPTRHPPTRQGPRPQTPQRPSCPRVDLSICVEPCIIFTNRVGCQECVCPVNPPAPDAEPGISLPDMPPSHPKQPQPTLPPFPPETTGQPFIAPPAPSRKQDEHRPKFVPGWPPSGPHSPASTSEAAQRGVTIIEGDVPPPSNPNFDLGEKCTQRLDPGPCKNFVERWHFNPVRGECEPFQYGGCAGNRNHFFTQKECVVHCARFSRTHEETRTRVITEPPATDAPSTEESQTQPPRTLPPQVHPPLSPEVRLPQPPLPTHQPRLPQANSRPPPPQPAPRHEPQEALVPNERPPVHPRILQPQPEVSRPLPTTRPDVIRPSQPRLPIDMPHLPEMPQQPATTRLMPHKPIEIPPTTNTRLPLIEIDSNVVITTRIVPPPGMEVPHRENSVEEVPPITPQPQIPVRQTRPPVNTLPPQLPSNSIIPALETRPTSPAPVVETRPPPTLPPLNIRPIVPIAKPSTSAPVENTSERVTEQSSTRTEAPIPESTLLSTTELPLTHGIDTSESRLAEPAPPTQPRIHTHLRPIAPPIAPHKSPEIMRPQQEVPSHINPPNIMPEIIQPPSARHQGPNQAPLLPSPPPPVKTEPRHIPQELPKEVPNEVPTMPTPLPPSPAAPRVEIQPEPRGHPPSMERFPVIQPPAFHPRNLQPPTQPVRQPIRELRPLPETITHPPPVSNPPRHDVEVPAQPSSEVSHFPSQISNQVEEQPHPPVVDRRAFSQPTAPDQYGVDAPKPPPRQPATYPAPSRIAPVPPPLVRQEKPHITPMEILYPPGATVAPPEMWNRMQAKERLAIDQSHSSNLPEHASLPSAPSQTRPAESNQGASQKLEPVPEHPPASPEKPASAKYSEEESVEVQTLPPSPILPDKTVSQVAPSSIGDSKATEYGGEESALSSQNQKAVGQALPEKPAQEQKKATDIEENTAKAYAPRLSGNKPLPRILIQPIHPTTIVAQTAEPKSVARIPESLSVSMIDSSMNMGSISKETAEESATKEREESESTMEKGKIEASEQETIESSSGIGKGGQTAVVDEGIEELERRTQFIASNMWETDSGKTMKEIIAESIRVETSTLTPSTTQSSTLPQSTAPPAPQTNAPSEEPSGTTAEWTTASAPTIRLSTTSFIQRPPPGETFDDTCVLLLDVGPCTDYVARWYFNSETATCEPFSYGNCNGNKNNFLTKDQCEHKCRAEIAITNQLPTRCTLPKDEGHGGGYEVKYYYNQRNMRCEQMVYQGDGGNDNRFSNPIDCDRSCKQRPEEIGFAPRNVVVHTTTTTEAPLSLKPNVHEGKIQKPEKKHMPDTRAGAALIAETNPNQGSVGAPAPSQPIDSQQKPNYGAEPLLPSNPDAMKNLPPMIGKSPPATINYQNGTRLDNKVTAEGLSIHVPSKVQGHAIEMNIDGKQGFEQIGPKGPTKLSEGVDGNKDELETINKQMIGPDAAVTDENSEDPRVPICPNGLSAMQYADGRPVMCLPGKDQCPSKSVCYFNGLDFFCCPNEDDPYDRHIFGGYDGEEVKHGYKNQPINLNIRSMRRSKRSPVSSELSRSLRRPLPPTSFSIDTITNPLRFDDKAPRSISSAGLASRRVSPCIQSVERGNCNEAHLRYFYDVDNDHCRLFYYSGCNGNSNNFATSQECEKRCKLGVIITQTAPPAVATPPTTPGRCPNGQMPLGDTSPVLCGNSTDSIGCPSGYYCRSGPPDVCCPNDASIDLRRLVNEQRERGDVRRKPFISAAGKFDGDDHHHHSQEGEKEHDEASPVVHGVPIQQQAKPTYDDISAPGSLTPNNAPTGSAADASATSSDSATSDVVQAASGQQSPAASSGSSSDSSSLQTPPTMCPDGSDALLDAFGHPVMCGAGFDGHELCPRGHYCSIDPERNGRLCCPLAGQGSQVPPPSGAIAPYFGHRSANPGEVIDRGSLPSDPKPSKLSTPKPRIAAPVEQVMPQAGMDYSDERSVMEPSQKQNEPHSSAPESKVPAPAAEQATEQVEQTPAPQSPAPQEQPQSAPSDAATSSAPSNTNDVPAPAMPAAAEVKPDYGHMLLKPIYTNTKAEKAIQDTKLHIDRYDDQRGNPVEEDPFETQMSPWKEKPKKQADKSVCFLKPHEGRACREDEPVPASNLQFFYSAKDRVCKVFFYRGCGGNANRFHSKTECQNYCMNKAN
ncbi:kunitz/Bovine pancreatic trypsin inhibitor domain-containing protein [Ditylenchus destructor]|nr:kunitz/Bovine pancreatic trypsin inhibitor domain-containing protein [Ditylenchus destructor]